MEPKYGLAKGLRHPAVIIIAVFLVQWALMFLVSGPTWDAAFYYVIARSPVFDHDLRLENDLELSYPTASPDFAAKAYHTGFTETGRIASPFAIGTSLLWMPLMTVMRFLLSFGSTSSINGFELGFVGAVATFSALCGLLAFWISYQISRATTDWPAALIASITLMFATPLVYYQFREPMYSHTSSALLATLCIYVWWRGCRSVGTPMQAIGLGAVIGFSGLTRWQNVMYLILPFLSTLFWWLALPGGEKLRRWKRPAVYLVLVTASALAVLSPQMAVWHLFYNTWTTVPQGSAYVDWRAPFLRQVLFSAFRGLLPWMPVVIPAAAGLISLGRKRPRLIIPLLAVLFLETYVNSSTRDWFGGGGFGPRRYTSELAILVLGYAGFLNSLPRPGRAWIGGILGLGFFLHQWILLRFGLVEKLGGRVVSMYPTYQWNEVSLIAFVRQLLGHIPDAGSRPLNFLVLPGSPIHLVLGEYAWPAHHLWALLAAATFFTGLWLSARPAAYFIAGSSGRQKASLILGFLAIIGIDVWILNWA